MTNKTRSLLHAMAEHMEYMQTCLKVWHEFDEWDDYYWFRRSEELLTMAVELEETEWWKPELEGLA